MKKIITLLILLVGLTLSVGAEKADISGTVSRPGYSSYDYHLDITQVPQAPAEYKLVEAKDAAELTHLITEMVKIGWVPLGQAFMSNTGNHFYQTMVKYGRY